MLKILPLPSDALSTSQRLHALLLVGLATVLFSAKSIFIKQAYLYGVQPVVLMTWRMLMALPFYLAVLVYLSYVKRQSTPSLNSIGFTCLFGCLGYYVASYLDLVGLVYLPASTERMILYLYPTFTLLLSAFVKKRRIKSAEWMTLILGYAGLGVIMLQNYQQAGPEALKGATLVIGSCLAFACFLIGSERQMQQMGSMMYTAYAMSAASVAIVVHFISFYPLTALYVAKPVLGYAAAIAFFSTVIPSFLMAAGVRKLGASHAAMAGVIGPVSTMLLAMIFLNEPITWGFVVGVILVLSAVYWLGKLKSA